MKKQPLFLFSCALMLASCGLNPGTSSSGESSKADSSAASTASSSKQGGTSSAASTSATSKAATSKSALPDIDHIQVFVEKSYINVWAWTNVDGKSVNVFKEWPGDKLKAYDDNWKTYEFTDYTSLSVIFSEENGTRQTKDLTISSPGYWWYYQNQWYRADPLEGQGETSSSSKQQQTSYSIPEAQIDGNYRTWYQLLVYSFADSDGDGIGDFKGIVDHLDYLKNLGIGGIWLSPIHNADSYHGYNVQDYRSVNSAYVRGGVGIEKLIEECHKKDIKVILDMVFNHTSNNHAWKREHSDWYSGEHIFDGSMPDLNYDNQDLRKAVIEESKYWLNKGIDGFRCDAAAWIYGGGNNWRIEERTYSKSRQWWTEWASALKAVKPDVYMVGEVYTDLQYIEQFFETGMSAFNFSGGAWAKDTIQSGDAEHKWVSEVVNHQARVRNKDANGIEASFISNHDTGRFASLGFDETGLKLANALNVLSPGGSYLYYGDELGMTGSGGRWDDMNYRTAMPWQNGRANSQKYMEGCSTQTYTKSGKTADEDAANANSIYGYTSRAIAFKNANPTLYKGQASVLNTGSSQIAALKMSDSDGTYAVIVNASGDKKALTVSGDYELVGDLATNGSVVAEKTAIEVPAKSIAIIKGSVTLSSN